MLGTCDRSRICIDSSWYAEISLKMLEKTDLNMPGFWIFLIIRQVWQTFEDTSDSKQANVLNMAQLYMQKSYTKFQICLSLHASVMPQYALVCFNVPQYGCEWLNIIECSWIYLKILELTVLTLPGFSIWCVIVIIILLLM